MGNHICRHPAQETEQEVGEGGGSSGARPPGTYCRELANRSHESVLHEAVAFPAHKHICEAQKSVEALAQLHKATTTELERKIIIFSQKGKKKKLIFQHVFSTYLPKVLIRFQARVLVGCKI